MLSSYIITKNDVQFIIKIIDKKRYPLSDMITKKDINSFISLYVVEIKIENSEIDEQYIMLQENVNNLKEIDLANESFIQKTVNAVYLEYNEKKIKIRLYLNCLISRVSQL